MKVILSVLIGLILVSSIQANACPRSEYQLVCRGDTVVSKYYVGTVLGVNPFQGTVAFESTDGGIFTMDKKMLALGVGCLDIYCVGDRVVYNNGRRDLAVVGSIFAVNPYDRTVVFQDLVDGKVYNSIYKIETLALGLGCVLGVCVDDTVVTSDNIVAKVIAVNPHNRTVAIKYADDIILSRPANSLAISEFSATYEKHPRTQISFPLVNEKSYVDANFRFSVERPLLP